MKSRMSGRLRAGHMGRMDDDHLPRRAYYEEEHEAERRSLEDRSTWPCHEGHQESKPSARDDSEKYNI